MFVRSLSIFTALSAFAVVAYGCATSTVTTGGDYDDNVDSGTSTSTSPTSPAGTGTSSTGGSGSGSSGKGSGGTGTGGTGTGGTGTGGSSTSPGGSSSTGASSDGVCSPQAVTTSSYSTWNPPTKMSGSCTTTESTALENAFNATSPTAASLEGSVSAKCAACIFTESATSSNWQLYVWTDKASNEGFFNVDACLKLAGISNTCATDDSGISRCVADSCDADPDCATASDTDYQSCESDAETGPCSSVGANISTDCSQTTYQSASTKCGYDSSGSLTDFSKLVSEICG